jgi:group I intron endonuclease
MIGNAITKYGTDNFNKTILENVPENQMDELEQEYIKKYNSLYPNGYNLLDGGNSNKHHHEKTKKKISEKGKGRIAWNKGISLTEEHKKNLSKSLMGKEGYWTGKSHPQTEETKKKISETNKKLGRIPPSHLGKKRSAETLIKMSEAHKGILHTAETKKKMSELKKRKI